MPQQDYRIMMTGKQGSIMRSTNQHPAHSRMGPGQPVRQPVRQYVSSLLAGLALLFGAMAAQAHELRPAIMDIGFSQDQSDRQPDRLSISVTFSGEAFLAGLDLSSITDTDDSDQSAAYDALRELSPDALARKVEAEFDRLTGLVTLSLGGTPVGLDLKTVTVESVADLRLARDTVLVLDAPAPTESQLVTVAWDPALGGLLIRQSGRGSDPAYTDFLMGGGVSTGFALSTEIVPTIWEVVIKYIHSGIIHIVPAGLDHILFVIGLLAYGLSGRHLVFQVSLFTAAHTLTLGMASVGLIVVSGDIVEPLIALSIAWIGIENIRRKSDRFHPSRAVVVFAFGLLHGLGFASVLSDFGLPAGAFVLGLLSFNVGVEIGQLIIVVPIFLILKAMKPRKDSFRRRFQWPVSAIISGIGLFWVAERTGLLGM